MSVVGRSVGWSACHYFLTGRGVIHKYSFRTTCWIVIFDVKEPRRMGRKGGSRWESLTEQPSTKWIKVKLT